MEHFENFNAWVQRLPAWCRWFFAFLLAFALIGASIYYTFYRTRAADQPKHAGVSTRSDIDRKVDHDVRVVGDLVQNELPPLERNRQAMESRAVDLLDESERLIAEAKRGTDGAQAGK